MEPILITILPGGKSELDEPHQGEEFGYVLEGEVVLRINNKHYKLKKGQTFYYQANKTHQLINTSNKITKIIWVSTPPMF